MLFGIVFMSLGTLLLGFVTSLLIASILYFIRQMGFGFFFPSLRAQQADVIMPVERGKIFGRVQFSFNLGGLIGPIIGTQLYQLFGGKTLSVFGQPFAGEGVPFALTGLVTFSLSILVWMLHIPPRVKRIAK